MSRVASVSAHAHRLAAASPVVSFVWPDFTTARRAFAGSDGASSDGGLSGTPSDPATPVVNNEQASAGQAHESTAAPAQPDAPPAQPLQQRTVSTRFVFDKDTVAHVPKVDEKEAVQGQMAQPQALAAAVHVFREPEPLDAIPMVLRPRFREVVRKRPAPLRVNAVWAALRAGDRTGRAALMSHFDPAVDCSVSLHIDSRKSDQLVRGTAALPHGTGRARRIAVFAEGAAAEAAAAAGAAVVGSDSLLAEIATKKAFPVDVVVATPDMMQKLSKVARILGPRGLMPNPKFGTVTEDIAEAVSRLQHGQLQFRNDKGGNVSVTIGRKSFSDDQLTHNFYAFFRELMRLRPKAIGGTDVQGFVERVSVSTTQGRGFPLAHEDLQLAARARFA